MASADKNINDFRAHIRGSFTPRSDRFEVLINFPQPVRDIIQRPDFSRNGPDGMFSLRCEECQIPGLAATTLPVKFGTWTEYRAQNVEFLSQEVPFTFVMDSRWSVREAFEAWINLCSNMVNKEVEFQDNVKSEMHVKALDLQDKVIGHWKFWDCTPKLINLTPMSWSNNNLVRGSVTMVAKYWTNEFATYNGTNTESKNVQET